MHGELWDRKEATFYLPNGSINTGEMLCAASTQNCCSFSFASVFLRYFWYIYSWDFYGNWLLRYELIRGRYNHVMTGTLSSSPEWTIIIYIHDFICIWSFFSLLLIISLCSFAITVATSSLSHSLYLLFVFRVFSSCHATKSKPNWHNIEAYLLHQQFIFQSMQYRFEG